MKFQTSMGTVHLKHRAIYGFSELHCTGQKNIWHTVKELALKFKQDHPNLECVGFQMTRTWANGFRIRMWGVEKDGYRIVPHEPEGARDIGIDDGKRPEL